MFQSRIHLRCKKKHYLYLFKSFSTKFVCEWNL